jgi:hypothetical protein
MAGTKRRSWFDRDLLSEVEGLTTNGMIAVFEISALDTEIR